MNSTRTKPPRPTVPDPVVADRSPRAVMRSLWTWMALAVVLIGASGAVRAWQERRFASVEALVEKAPFDLGALPRTLGNGDWRLRDGGESTLDPEVAQVAGCTDSLIRTYTNAASGVSLTALILFGPSKDVFAHVPEVCYPAAGYRMVDDPILREIPIGTGPAAAFRAELYTKQKAVQRWRNEVYYSFRHGDRWIPDPEKHWKEFRRSPSMFKVQVQRAVSETERRDVKNPSEEFLELLVPEIERRIAQGQVGTG
jgi:hypothetical protein